MTGIFHVRAAAAVARLSALLWIPSREHLSAAGLVPVLIPLFP